MVTESWEGNVKSQTVGQDENGEKPDIKTSGAMFLSIYVLNPLPGKRRCAVRDHLRMGIAITSSEVASRTR